VLPAPWEEYAVLPNRLGTEARLVAACGGGMLLLASLAYVFGPGHPLLGRIVFFLFASVSTAIVLCAVWRCRL